MYLLPFNHRDHQVTDNGWRFFIECKDAKGEESDFLDAAEAVDFVEFELAWIYVSKLARLGSPWKTLIPEAKRFHDVGQIGLRHLDGSHSRETVWEFKHGKIRILWCYTGHRRAILFGHTLLKKRNNITAADLHHVEVAMQKFITAHEGGLLKIAGDKDHERTFSEVAGGEQPPPRLQKKKPSGRGKR